MDELLTHLEFAKILGIFSIGTIIITLIFYLIAKKNRIFKYIPGIILFIFGVYNLFSLGQDNSSIESFYRLHMVLIAMISGFVGLSTGLIIGVIVKGKNS